MQNTIALYKPVGLTPLVALNKFRASNPEFAQVKIGYAGRLDPLAHGVLLLMIGNATKQRNKYLALPKSYEFTACFGMQTDTYDILGLVQNLTIGQPDKNVNIFVNTFVNKYIGKLIMKYPPYSSKTINGKALFWWARNNKLKEITIPEHVIEIFEFRFLGGDEISVATLKQKIDANINSVQGDFRQNEILNQWNQLFSKIDQDTRLKTATFFITCSSGTYIRELIHLMGKELGCGAFALDILRTAVGEFSINSAKRL
jgi:tRNA pseudouridine55 synthase